MSPQLARFYLRGTHGYKVAVVAAVEGVGSPVRIVVEDHAGGAEYQVPGAVTPDKIHAAFGRLGGISLRFRPSGRVLHSLDQGGGCSRRAKARLGTFFGTIRFRGEGGYTTVSSHRVTGGIGAPTAPINQREQLKLGCQNAAETHILPPDQISQLFSNASTEKSTLAHGIIAAATAPNEATLFTALSFSFRHPEEEGAKPDSCLFAAAREETQGEIAIARTVFGGGPVSQCQFDESNGIFNATPGRPFTGSAVSQRNTDGSTGWLGSLSVPMLGVGVVPLAGPEFQSELLRR